ncbi:MAG: primosomal protein N' [Firmicutes bacterium]|nr:primosomal protein N' [Bacillota bacterium]MDH7495620.1 primosomal protein N' [Bacillota bacterium]
MFAEVVVDVPTVKAQKPFHYGVPARLRESVRVGSAVVVPFGGRRLVGYVVGFVETPDVASVKDIIEVSRQAEPLSEEMMTLATWMTSRYVCLPAEAIAQMFPAAVRRGKVTARTKTLVELAISPEEAKAFIARVERRAPRQADIVRVLLERGGQEVSEGGQGAHLTASPDAVRALIRKGVLVSKRVEVMRSPLGGATPRSNRPTAPIRLTADQEKAVSAVLAAMDRPNPRPILLHGVTASGKTEVYMRAIEAALARGRSAIVLVPEIALTPQLARAFHERFGGLVALLHSRLSAGERYDEWRRTERGEARIVVGARSAVFAPLRDLGLVVIDEEHENSYKQEESPRYHAREVARERARVVGCVCLLGSATPSVESFYRARTGEYDYLALTSRVEMRPLPSVEIVDMREELASGNRSVFSRALVTAVRERLARREQVILFLNRRGHSTFVLCRECGHALRCPECDVALTYHAEEGRMRCHYCDHEEAVPNVCPKCGSSCIRYFGAGTERIEQEVARVFPHARVVRMDLDTTRGRMAHERIVDAFRDGHYDIMVGTQMVAKGHDFPRVTLVGVVSADTCLNLPDYKAGERTFQLLTQAAGRAGRGEAPGQVIIQTYAPDHYSVRRARDHDYLGFYEEEVRARRELSYPPFVSLVLLVVSGEDLEEVERHARGLAAAMRVAARKVVSLPPSTKTGSGEPPTTGVRVLGPAPCAMRRVRRLHRWQVLVKGATVEVAASVVREGLAACPARSRDIMVQVDVDPESVL